MDCLPCPERAGPQGPGQVSINQHYAAHSSLFFSYDPLPCRASCRAAFCRLLTFHCRLRAWQCAMLNAQCSMMMLMLDTRPSFRPCRLRVDPRVYWLASRPVSQRNVTSLRGYWGQRPLHAPCASPASPDSTRGDIAHQCYYTAREPRHSSAKATTQASRPSRYICFRAMKMPAAA
jgi:hypothetical protein